MKVYRCCSEDEVNAYKEGKVFKRYLGSGTNTFKYEKDKQYIHFFYFAECMYFYKSNKNDYSTEYYVEYDIPTEVLKKYLGYGYYERIIPGFYTPVPEFSIPYDEFKVEYVKDIFKEEKLKCLRIFEWKKYLKKLPLEYLADYECGSFQKGYDENSVLNYSFNNVLCKNKRK